MPSLCRAGVERVERAGVWSLAAAIVIFVVIGLQDITEARADSYQTLAKSVDMSLTENIAVHYVAEYPDISFPPFDFFCLTESDRVANDCWKIFAEFSGVNDVVCYNFFIENRIRRFGREHNCSAYAGNNPWGLPVVFKIDLGHWPIATGQLLRIWNLTVPRLDCINAVQKIVFNNRKEARPIDCYGSIGGFFCGFRVLSCDAELFAEGQLVFPATAARLRCLSLHVPELTLASDVKTDCRKPENYGCNREDSGKKRQPPIVSGDSLVWPFFPGLVIGLALRLGGSTLIYRLVRRI